MCVSEFNSFLLLVFHLVLAARVVVLLNCIGLEKAVFATGLFISFSLRPLRDNNKKKTLVGWRAFC